MRSIFILCVLLILSVAGHSQIRYLVGKLDAAQQGGGVVSPGGGVVIVKYNMATRLLQHYGNYRGLTAAISNQHIHTAPPGSNGPVTVQLTSTGGTYGYITGSQVLTPAQEASLLAGNMYTNVHTPTYPGGEIRAQLTLTTDGQTDFVNARLQGAQSVPPNSSAGTGVVNAVIDRATHMLYLTSYYSGLTTAASNAYIHLGAPGTNGVVIVPLIYVTDTAGTLDTARVINTTDEANILSGNTYVNVHTSTYPGGEIRGQLSRLSQMHFFASPLEGAQEVPPNASTAKGTVIVRYDTATKQLELVGDYQNLTTTISGSHIHGPAAPGANAPVLFTLNNTGGIIGVLTGTFTLTPAQQADLFAGNMYVNVHSTTFPGGEIRGQLMPTTVGESQVIVGSLSASQSVATPAVSSPGTGASLVLLDRVTNKLFLTANFSGLTSNITNAHIHAGRTGSNGSVVVPLSFAGTTAGTLSGTATIRPTLTDSIINGLTYVNIHTSTYPSGEIRGQLADLVLPVKLGYFTGYKDRNKVALVWEAQSEEHMQHYEVEQQNTITGKWVNKKIVKATGVAPAKYTAIDEPTDYGKSYVIYRLLMLGKDGQVEYSPVVKINTGSAEAELVIKSNPVGSSLNFQVTGLKNNDLIQVYVIDQTGRKVFNERRNAFGLHTINTASLPAGIYTLAVQAGDNVVQERFIKQ